MNLIKHRYKFLGFSAVLVSASLFLVIFLGLRLGIDMKGGAEWQIAFENRNTNEEEIRNALEEINPELKATIRISEEKNAIIRMEETDEKRHQEYVEAIKTKIGEFKEISFSSIGPTIGYELKKQSIKAIIFVILGISIYIAFAFRKISKPVPSWKYGVATLISLFHDVSVPSGLLAFLGWYKGIEIDTNFIVALLVVMGFSVHDTIVVFDRIRENVLVKGRKLQFYEIINSSINETLARSINTTLTLILVLVALLLWGPASLFYFILTILVGTIVGTYSSIFVASPIIYIWSKKKE